MWAFITSIQNWFSDFSERRRLLNNFNFASKQAFIEGVAPTLLQCSISMGEVSYRHAFSKFMAGGFRIKALSGTPLSRREMQEIGHVILGNQNLVRQLVSLGWDTLEVHDNAGYNGLKWKLYDHSGIGGMLNSFNHFN